MGARTSFLAIGILLSGGMLAQSNNIFSGGAGGGTALHCFSQPVSNGIFAGGASAAPVIACANEPFSLVEARVILQGAYDDGSGLMRDDLRQLGLIPNTEPYSSLGIALSGGDTLDPGVLDSTDNNAVIDWVLIETRSTSDSSVVLLQHPALLLADGRIAGPAGANPMKMKVNEASTFLSVRHRNHLGAMFDTVTTFAGVDTVRFDWSDTSQTKYGTNAMYREDGKDLLWSGNTHFPGKKLSYTGLGNDRDPILVAIGGSVPTNTASGYLVHDVNMDGTVQYTGLGNDRDPILVNIGGSVPTAVIDEQLP